MSDRVCTVLTFVNISNIRQQLSHKIPIDQIWMHFLISFFVQIRATLCTYFLIKWAMLYLIHTDHMDVPSDTST